jgi:hypothetical protein
MYRLRDFEAADLPTIERELPSHAEIARELRGQPAPLHGLIVHDPRDRVVGLLVAVRHELVTNTRTIGLGIVRLAYIQEQARIGGVHSMLHELDTAFAERFEGPDKVFQAMIAQWHEQDVWCLRRLRNYEPIAQSLSFVGRVRGIEAPADVAVRELTAADLDADGGITFDAGPDMGMRRTAAMLRAAAARDGRRAWILQRGRAVLGWAVRRLDGAEAVVEAHWIPWYDAPLAAALVAPMMADAEALRVTRWTSDPNEFAGMQDVGLCVSGPERVVSARVSAFGMAPPSLADFASLGVADVGDEPLPQLSYNERITTPPPPGTPSTRGDHRRSAGTRKFESR